MYVIPIVVLVLLALIGVVWSPLFALVIAVPAFLIFLAYVGMRPRADEQIEPLTGNAGKYEDETPRGAWGERRT
jgi:ABC-type transport system involved in cytochrome bd biosynthesis fused ATPase/permease subunit